MEENSIGIGVFNPAKDIAREVTLQVLIRHRDATMQAREGILPGIPEEIPEHRKKINKIKGLFKMISSQREMINISRPIIRFSCFKSWEKKHEKEEEKLKEPFEKEDNDYNQIIITKTVLEEAELDLVRAEQNKNPKEDYLIENSIGQQRTLSLSEKYYEMLNGLEKTYEQIYFMMVKYRIVSTGLEEDELKTYKELEEEAIKRVIDA